MLELAWPATRLAELSEKLARCREDLDPVVVKVGDVDATLRVNTHPGGDAEPPAPSSGKPESERSAPLRPETPVGPEDLDAVVISIGSHHPAVRQDRHIRRVVQCSAPGPSRAAHDGHEAAVSSQLLDTMFVEVGDVEIAVWRQPPVHPAHQIHQGPSQGLR